MRHGYKCITVAIALIAGCVNGLALTGLISGSNAVSEGQSWVTAWVGLALLLIGPIIGAIFSRSWRTQVQA